MLPHRMEGGPAGSPRIVVAPRSGPAPAGGAVRARLSEPPERLDYAERERRSHVRRWARFMITHLERSDFEAAEHYTYTAALERLRELIDRELEQVRGADARAA